MMNDAVRGTLARLVGRLAVALMLALGLSACAIPPAVSIASMAVDGVLLVATGKSKADHGLSLASGKDCATFRVLDGEDICQEVVVAQLEPLPAEVARELTALRAASNQPQPRLRTEVAMAAAFRAPEPVVLAAAPAPVVAAAARDGGGRVRLAALRPPPTGVTPGRVKIDRPGVRRSLVTVAATDRGARVAAGPSVRRLALAKAKRLAALENRRLQLRDAGARPDRPGAAGMGVVGLGGAAAPPSGPPAVHQTRAGAPSPGPQLALAGP